MHILTTPKSPLIFLISFLIFCFFQQLAYAKQDVCNDLNALHELKFSSDFKNTVQSFRFLKEDKMLVSTQGIQFTDWKSTFAFHKTQFTEANGGQNQIKSQFSASLDKIVKDFVLLNGDENSVLMAQVDKDRNVLFNLNADKEIGAPYPLDSENIYDADGNVVSTEQYTKITLHDISYETSRRQLQLQPAQDDTKDSFLALIFSEGSLKLVQAQVVDDEKNPHVQYTWSTLVVPKVKDFDVESANYDSILLEDQYDDHTLVVVTLDKKQKAAFEKIHDSITLDFQHMDRVPFVLSFDSTGKLLSARNVVNADFKTLSVLHVSGVDLRDNMLIVVGNTFSTSSIQFLDEATRAYVSVINLSLLTADSKMTQVLNLLHDRDASLGFVVRDVVFAPDAQSTDLFLFAGDVQMDKENLYDVEARIILSDGQRSFQQILVGESGANVVRSMTRYNLDAKQGESVICDIFMDGPTDKAEHPDDPTEDPFRKVNAGFWQVDCSSPNYTLETVAFGSFFAVLGVGMFVFITGVSAFSVICFFELREKRRAKNALKGDDELSRLIN